MEGVENGRTLVVWEVGNKYIGPRSSPSSKKNTSKALQFFRGNYLRGLDAGMEKSLYARPSVTDIQWCGLKQAKE